MVARGRWHWYVPTRRAEGKGTMRRILMAILLLALVGTTGCLTPEDKRQWQEAVGDLRQDNIKNIAPLSGTKKSE